MFTKRTQFSIEICTEMYYYVKRKIGECGIITKALAAPGGWERRVQGPSSTGRMLNMSSRVFQSVIVQMKEATERCIGVVDEQGFVIACSELSMIGSHLDDLQAALTDNRNKFSLQPSEHISCSA